MAVDSNYTVYSILLKCSTVPCGSLLAVSGPFIFFFFLPTRVGIGGSYFLFFSYRNN